jgi:hypothetical protein
MVFHDFLQFDTKLAVERYWLMIANNLLVFLCDPQSGIDAINHS